MLLKKILRAKWRLSPGDFLYNVEMKVHGICNKMHVEGVKIDMDSLEEVISGLEKEEKGLKKEVVKSTGIENPNDPMELGSWVYEEKKLTEPLYMPDSNSFKITNGILEEIAEGLDDSKLRNVIEKIVGYRRLYRNYAGYLNLKNLVVLNGEDYRIHVEFDTVRSDSGRIFSEKPNLQQLGEDLKRFFIPGNSSYLVEYQYRDYDMAVLAADSQEPLLQCVFDPDVDVHKEVAKKLFDKDEIDAYERNVAFTLNLSLIYGTDFTGIQSRIGYSRKDTADIIEKHAGLFSNISDWKRELIRESREKGYVETILGRKRSLPNIWSSNGFLRGKDEKKAVSNRVQGSVADIMKLKLVELDSELENSSSRLALSQHNSILLEVCEQDAEEILENIKDVMTFKQDDYLELVPEHGGLKKNWEDCRKEFFNTNC